MIQPDDIRRSAGNLYAEFLRDWLKGGQSFFPRVIRGRKKLPADDLATAIDLVHRLRSESKEVRGYGYSVRWEEVNSRSLGRNQFPSQILFETQDDFVRFIGKRDEFATFAAAATELQASYPQLAPWIRSHVQVLIDLANELPGLLHVLRHFETNPRPAYFARELPLPVDTKFIEGHQRVLREWFDLVLPPQSIRADENHFERRYGLRYPEPHILLRFLDIEIQRELGFPCSELSLPLETVRSLSVVRTSAIIVENKVNLLTLPSIPRFIGLGALGDGVTLLGRIPWLEAARVIYWGDIDVEGFEILSAVRAHYPHAESFLMDEQTLGTWGHLALPGNGFVRDVQRLSNGERAALSRCCAENIRLEQERIPHAAVIASIGNISGSVGQWRRGDGR
jgi:hypothetical protein